METTSYQGKVYDIQKIENYILQESLVTDKIRIDLLSHCLKEQHTYWEEVDENYKKDIFGPFHIIEEIKKIKSGSIKEKLEELKSHKSHWKYHIESILFHIDFFEKNDQIQSPLWIIENREGIHVINGVHRLTALALLKKEFIEMIKLNELPDKAIVK